MFLTRLGFGSKAVVTGDVTQIDLPDGRGRSGLLQVRDVLDGIDGLVFVELGSRDVVRHRIVQDIVDAYERHDERPGAADDERRRASNVPMIDADGVRRRRAARDRGRRRRVGSRLAQLVLDDERVIERYGADVEMSLLFVDEHDDRRAQRALPRRERPDRRARVPDRRRAAARRAASPTRAGAGPGTAVRPERSADAARRRGRVPGGREPPGRRARSHAPTTSWRCSSCTVCCTCSTTTTPNRRDRRDAPARAGAARGPRSERESEQRSVRPRASRYRRST